MEILKKSELIKSTKTYKITVDLDTTYDCEVEEITPLTGSKNIFKVINLKYSNTGKNIIEDDFELVSKTITSFIERNVIKLN
jgi:hypothetical protein